MLNSGEDELFYLGIKAMWPLSDPMLLLKDREETLRRAHIHLKVLLDYEADTVVAQAEEMAERILSLLNEMV